MKKSVSIFLTILMLTTLLPLSVFAANGDVNVVRFSGASVSQYTTKTNVTATLKSNTGSDIHGVTVELDTGSLPSGEAVLKDSFNNVVTTNEKILT